MHVLTWLYIHVCLHCACTSKGVGWYYDTGGGGRGGGGVQREQRSGG